MTKVISSTAPDPKAAAQDRRSAGFEWGPLAALAGVFALVSLADIALAFVPLNLGAPGWEFGTATTVLNNLPLAVVGIGLLGVAGLGRKSVGLVRSSIGLAGLVTALLLFVAVMLGRNVGEALRSVTDPLLLQGVKESILRSTIQLVGYLGAMGWLIVRLRQLIKA